MGSVERGERNLSFSNLHRIAQALEITLSRLLVGVEAKAEELRKKSQGSSDVRSK